MSATVSAPEDAGTDWARFATVTAVVRGRVSYRVPATFAERRAVALASARHAIGVARIGRVHRFYGWRAIAADRLAYAAEARRAVAGARVAEEIARDGASCGACDGLGVWDRAEGVWRHAADGVRVAEIDSPHNRAGSPIAPRDLAWP